MAIDWLTKDGDTTPDTDSDNPIQANYFEENATIAADTAVVEVTPAMEEVVLEFERLNLSTESLDSFIDLAYRLDGTGLVSRADAQAARAVLMDFDARASLKAYTVHPSKTRYQQAMESMSGGMIAMLAAAAAAVIAIVYKVLKMIFGRSDPITAGKLEKLADKKEPTAADIQAVIDVTPTAEETVEAHEETAELAHDLGDKTTEMVFDTIPDYLDKAFHANEITYVGFENSRTDQVHQIRSLSEYNKVLFAYLREIEPMILQEHAYPFRSVAFTVALSGDIHSLVSTMDAIAKEVEKRRQVTVGWASEIAHFLANYDQRTTEEKLLAFKAMNVRYSEQVNAPVLIPKVSAATGGTIGSLGNTIRGYFESVVEGMPKPSLHNVRDLAKFFYDNPLANGKAPQALLGVIKNRRVMLTELAEVSGAIDLINSRLNQVTHARTEGAFDPQLARDISGAIDDIRKAQQGVTMAIGVMEHEVSLYENDFGTMIRILSETIAFVGDLHIGYAPDVTADKATNVKALLEIVKGLQTAAGDVAKEVKDLNSRARASRRKLAEFAERTFRLQLPRPK